MVCMREVHLHFIENFELGDRLPELVKERVSERLRSVAMSRLGSIDVGFRSYDLVLKMVVESGRQFARLADVKCTKFALRVVCMYCFRGLPVDRTRANTVITRCVQEPALAQSLGSYTRLSVTGTGAVVVCNRR